MQQVDSEVPRSILATTSTNNKEELTLQAPQQLQQQPRYKTTPPPSSGSESDSDSSWSHQDEGSSKTLNLRAIWERKHKKVARKKNKTTSITTTSSCPTLQQSSKDSKKPTPSPPPPSKLLLNHGQRQLQKLQVLHDSLVAHAKNQPTNGTLHVKEMLELSLQEQKHASLKQWVNLQKQIYSRGSMPKAQKVALRQAGISLRKTKKVSTSETCTATTSTASTTCTAQQEPQEQETTTTTTTPAATSNNDPLDATAGLLVVKQQDGTILEKYHVNAQEIEQLIAPKKKKPTPLKEEPISEDYTPTHKRKRSNPDTNGTPKKKKQSKRKRKLASTQSFRTSPSEAAKRQRKRPPKTQNPRVGDTIWVHFQDDDYWFQGTIQSNSEFGKYGILKVDWKDGTVGEINVSSGGWGIDNDPLANYNAPKEKRVQDLTTGTRLSIYWPEMKQHYDGTLVEINHSKAEPHKIHYDDGEVKWYHLNQVQFMVLEQDDDDEEEAEF